MYNAEKFGEKNCQTQDKIEMKPNGKNNALVCGEHF